MRAAVLAFLLTPVAAHAEPPAAPETNILEPGHVELKVTADADAFFVYVDVGAAVEVGLFRIRGGTVGLGAELDYGICVTLCLASETLGGMREERTFLLPQARLIYHFPIGGSANYSRADFYALAIGGPVYTWYRATRPDGTVELEGHGIGGTIGLGIGAHFFLTDRFFIGNEIRARYGFGAGSLGVRSGWFASGQAVLTGLNGMLFVGARF